MMWQTQIRQPWMLPMTQRMHSRLGAVAAASSQNSGTMIWIVLLVIAVILAGAGIVFVKKGKKKEE